MVAVDYQGAGVRTERIRVDPTNLFQEPRWGPLTFAGQSTVKAARS